ncbi:hypothetical protein Lesp02_52480 [Lentzea sp. NBRC 105346]|uniref:hypothetical protein n=1 Tax=Lentzea sp. NBRC 105346 TaxID=3032205 RepID=UPI0024A411CE|nr:hypothetical protein [Lentzea sp. NBRC 105346]GLZ33060.1 hypothetical protein Lesp02_52480 [Lentzea sp. NBRC 105346]
MDLMKELAKAKPPAPEVDPVRMELDLTRITSMPRPEPPRSWMGAASFRRWSAPILAASFAVALLIGTLVVLPSSNVEVAATDRYWHAAQHELKLVPVGSADAPYVMVVESDSERWVDVSPEARGAEIKQLNGQVRPWTPDDVTKWQQAGKPETVPMVDTSGFSLRVGPLKPAVSGWYSHGVELIGGRTLDYDQLRALPGEPAALREAMEQILRDEKSDESVMQRGLLDRVSRLPALPVRRETRAAAIALLKTLPGVRQVDASTLGFGAGPFEQFKVTEQQLVIDPRTLAAVELRRVLLEPQAGLPAGTVVRSEKYTALEMTNKTPQLPAGVPVNGPLDSPVIMSR